MALQRLRGVGVGSASVSTRRVVSCCAFKPASQRQQALRAAEAPKQLASQLLAAGLALGITLSGVAPAMAATPYNSLADIVRSAYGDVDENKDGVITKDELIRKSKAVAEDVEFAVPEEQQLDFIVRLYDLNQDGTLATDELLSAIALDGAVAVGEGVIDEDVVRVFDKDADGFVSLPEFRSGLPPLGPNGEATKEFVFHRVDRLVDGDGKLGLEEFANALTLMRASVLGY